MLSYNPYYEKYLMHYGTPTHSGRYPYGSGKRPFQHFVEGFTSNLDTISKIALAASVAVGGYALGFKVGSLVFNKSARVALKTAITKFGKTALNKMGIIKRGLPRAAAKFTKGTIKKGVKTTSKGSKNIYMKMINGLMKSRGAMKKSAKVVVKTTKKVVPAAKILGITGLGMYGVTKVSQLSTDNGWDRENRSISIGF